MIQYPGKFKVLVDTSCNDVWANNPNIGGVLRQDCRAITMHYPGVHESHMIATGHFMKCFCDYLGDQLGIPLKLQVNKPSLYLSSEEKHEKPIEGQYIVVNSGTKQDYTCKGWGHSNYQEACDKLSEKFKIVQIGEKHHLHKPIRGAIDLVGQTSVRQLFKLCYHASAGIGGVTFLQHIMAALDKPYVCLLGGREPVSFIWYPTQSFLATQGQLPCCTPKACWKSRVVALNDGDVQDGNLCSLPVLKNDEHIPKCMEMIKPHEVVRAVERYVEGGIIQHHNN